MAAPCSRPPKPSKLPAEISSEPRSSRRHLPFPTSSALLRPKRRWRGEPRVNRSIAYSYHLPVKLCSPKATRDTSYRGCHCPSVHFAQSKLHCSVSRVPSTSADNHETVAVSPGDVSVNERGADFAILRVSA